MRPTPAPTTAPCRALDIRRLARAGDLQPSCRAFRSGGAGDTFWHFAVAIDAAGADDRPHLATIVPLRLHGEPTGRVGEPLTLDWTPCHYGGARPWFVCPGPEGGPACGRRVAILYAPLGQLWGWCCRSCRGLRYLSTTEDARSRNFSQICKLMARLSGPRHLHGPLPGRPKGMHSATYERLCLAITDRRRAHIQLVQQGRRARQARRSFPPR